MDYNFSFGMTSFVDLASGKKAEETQQEEQVLNTIKQTINIFSGIGYKLRPLIPTAKLPEEIFENQFKFRGLENVNFSDLLDERKSYLVEKEIVKSVFNNAIFTLNKNNEIHNTINTLCKGVRNEEFDVSRISHEYQNIYREGQRTFHFKFSIGNKSFDFDSVEERGVLFDLLVKFDEFLKQWKTGIYRIEESKDFIILQDSEVDVLLGISWKLSKNYFPEQTQPIKK